MPSWSEAEWGGGGTTESKGRVDLAIKITSFIDPVTLLTLRWAVAKSREVVVITRGAREMMHTIGAGEMVTIAMEKMEMDTTETAWRSSWLTVEQRTLKKRQRRWQTEKITDVDAGELSQLATGVERAHGWRHLRKWVWEKTYQQLVLINDGNFIITLSATLS